MYLYRVNVLFYGDEDAKKELNLEKQIDNFLKGTEGEIVSSFSEELFGSNFGRCEKCGSWTSDHSKENHVSSFSNGAKLDEIWLCDLCLPEEHPNSF